MALSGKTIVVTGAAGLVGSNLVRRLVADGNTVIGIDNYFAGTPEAHVAGVEYRSGHTRDIETLVPERVDIVYHLGEYSRVEQSLEEPDIVWDLNIRGTFGVVEFWRKRKCKLVYAGSSTKFADGGLARNATPYAWTKATNTELVQNYGAWYSLPYAITYFYNVYGRGERSGRYGTVIAIFAEQVRNGQPITVTSPGTQQRNFTHIDDIVDGLVLVGEKGEGDGFGLGNEKTFSVLDVARLFGGDIVMLPPRAGNRMSSAIDTSKSRALGWEPKRSLEDEIHTLVEQVRRDTPRKKEHRVLVFSTTFHPVEGPAEKALLDVIRAMPDVIFDVVTTQYSRGGTHESVYPENVHVHRVGYGTRFDKYLLPIVGYNTARQLHGKHSYIFAWSLLASYGALAALVLKRTSKLPLLVTLADQRIDTVPWYTRLFLRVILRGADQVYASEFAQEKVASRISDRIRMRSSMGEGDAFANQIRFAYADFLRSHMGL